MSTKTTVYFDEEEPEEFHVYYDMHDNTETSRMAFVHIETEGGHVRITRKQWERFLAWTNARP